MTCVDGIGHTRRIRLVSDRLLGLGRAPGFDDYKPYPILFSESCGYGMSMDDALG